MRSWAFALVAAAVLLVGSGGAAPGSQEIPWLSPPDTAFASTGTVRFSPGTSAPGKTAWNANVTTVDLQAQSVAVTTQCSTNPEDPQAPLASCGLGGFNLTVFWDPAHFNYVNIQGASMLTQTGRTLTCFTPTVGSSTVNFQCATYGTAPGLPLGPQGTGSLATLYLDPIAPSCCVLSPVAYTSAILLDISGNEFPGTPQAGSIQAYPCADAALPGSGSVDLQDTIQILLHFGQSSPPADARYNPTGLVDGFASIDLQDAILSLAEFGQLCVYPG